MRKEEFILDLTFEDTKYNCYRSTVPLKILNDQVDSEDCEIYISKKYNLSQIVPLINDYLMWLQNCSSEVTKYFEQKAGVILPIDWFDSIEVYEFTLTVNSPDDFGATIVFGESVFSDHILEFDFEKYEILHDRLNG